MGQFFKFLFASCLGFIVAILALTFIGGAIFTQMYGDLLRKYHGHDEGVLTIDEPYDREWAYIPHFYYDMYVFQ